MGSLQASGQEEEVKVKVRVRVKVSSEEHKDVED